MSCLQSRFIASPIQLGPPNNKRQPVFIGHWPDIQEICSQNTQLCQMPAMWCGQAKHCSVLQFPHQEKWKQFVLLSHLTYINPQTFQTGLVSNRIEAQQQKRQAPSPLYQCHLAQWKEQIKNTAPGATSSPSCFLGCQKTNSHWVRLVSATCNPSLVWAQQPSAASRCAGERCGSFAGYREWWGPLRAAASDPITAANSRMREEKVKLPFVTAELLLDLN